MANFSSRRQFLARAGGSAAALGLTASVVRGAAGSNERISIGLIGCGDRMADHLNNLGKLGSKHNVSVTALCDVWKVNLDAKAELTAKLFGAPPETCTRFGELLASKEVDAVVIATPDFAHGPVLVAALAAGKDVYIEKPMTIQLEHANRALDLARQKPRVVQVGTQYRSHGPILGVTREVATGSLGTISRVSSAASFCQARWKRAYDNCRPADVDWEAYLLNLPSRSFYPSLLREWHLHRETSNGLAGLWQRTTWTPPR